jgi:hypothetical protein
LFGSGSSNYYLQDDTSDGLDDVFINGTDSNDEFLFRKTFVASVHSPTAWEYIHLLGTGLSGTLTVYLFHKNLQLIILN